MKLLFFFFPPITIINNLSFKIYCEKCTVHVAFLLFFFLPCFSFDKKYYFIYWLIFGLNEYYYNEQYPYWLKFGGLFLLWSLRRLPHLPILQSQPQQNILFPTPISMDKGLEPSTSNPNRKITCAFVMTLLTTLNPTNLS